MYKAIIEVGGYKVGEEVPTEKAEAWNKAFAVPHCEKYDGESKESEVKTEEKSESEEKSSVGMDAMLDDYLGRNEAVVRNNIKKDDLSKKQLDGLLELEKSDKKRNSVIVAIKNKLKRLKD